MNKSMDLTSQDPPSHSAPSVVPSSDGGSPYNFQDPPSHSAPSVVPSSDGDSPYNSENVNFSYTVLKYMNDILMEEDVDGETCTLQDCFTLQATEKSFYDVLGQNYPPTPNHFSSSINQNGDIPDDDIIRYSIIASNSGDTAAFLVNCPEASVLPPNLLNQLRPFGDSRSDPNGDASTSAPMYDHLEHFMLEKVVVDDAENEGRHYSSNGSRGRKNHRREDGGCLEEGRSNKHLVHLLEDSEESHLFDEVMIPKCGSYDSVHCPLFEAAVKRAPLKLLPCNENITRSNSRIMHMMRQANTNEVVDLWSLLTQCAQSVVSYDQRTASELLKQIRLHASPFGDGTERLAHYFANGLEARFAGTRIPYSSPAISNGVSVADILKAHIVYVSASPFKKSSNFLANGTIGKTSEKATRLHIIDFGISYGFQWPCFIQRQSFRPGGPPRIRITGIELPQPGLHPAERVEETGRRLEKVADRCNVPFEYTAIAQKWETIKLEDLKIDRDEVIVVTCMYRLNNIPDDTVELNSPRDAVLNLIKRINPDLFVHGVANGTYNSPFFVSRFREALFHFSALFDMFNATVSSEDKGRMVFEREVLGRHVMNVIACEGLARTDSPETYKQWQARDLRAGFRQLPLDPELLKRVKKMVKTDYHKDFVVDENGKWLLQGWKGKVLFALSFWKPVQE